MGISLEIEVWINWISKGTEISYVLLAEFRSTLSSVTFVLIAAMSPGVMYFHHIFPLTPEHPPCSPWTPSTHTQMVANSWLFAVQRKWALHKFFLSLFDIAWRSSFCTIRQMKDTFILTWSAVLFTCTCMATREKNMVPLSTIWFVRKFPLVWCMGGENVGDMIQMHRLPFASNADVFYTHMPRWWPLWHF